MDLEETMPGDQMQRLMQMMTDMQQQSTLRDQQHEARYDEHKAEQQRMREQLAESNAKFEQQQARAPSPEPTKAASSTFGTTIGISTYNSAERMQLSRATNALDKFDSDDADVKPVWKRFKIMSKVAIASAGCDGVFKPAHDGTIYASDSKYIDAAGFDKNEIETRKDMCKAIYLQFANLVAGAQKDIVLQYAACTDFLSAWHALDTKNTGGIAGAVLDLLRQEQSLISDTSSDKVLADPQLIYIKLLEFARVFKNLVPDPDERDTLRIIASLLNIYQRDLDYRAICDTVYTASTTTVESDTLAR